MLAPPGGPGGPVPATIRPFESFRVGETVTDEQVVTAGDIDRFSELTGDTNALHMDADFARKAGTGGRVAHGMLTLGYVSRVIGTQLPGPGALWFSQAFKFRAPVRIGDRIRVEVRVRHLSPATRVLVLAIEVTNQRGQVVLDGEAHVHLLDTIAPVAASGKTAVTAVVTGSGRGIGAAIARRLAADGFNVVVNYRSDHTAAEETAANIRAVGGEATVCQADVSELDGAAQLIDYATCQYGPVDVLVNNAGSPIDPRPLVDLSWDDLSRHLAVHLGGAFLCVQAALPAMVEQKFGRIINVVSESATGVPPSKMAGYVVAKAALAAYTRCLALEVGPNGVTANAVAPGMTETEMVSHVPQRTKMALAAQVPLRRMGRPEDTADVVAFLAGPGGGYLTGQTIHVSGGQVMS
jgi:3-oxoacyl-[acyl-carrier protein] reductase